MATKKHGILSLAPEWAKHLRPRLKRAFWKRERDAGKKEVVRQQAMRLHNDERRALDGVNE